MDAMMLVATLLVPVLIVSLCAFHLALFSYFLDFCLWRGSIFDFWLPLVARTITKISYPDKYNHFMKISDKMKRNLEFMDLMGVKENKLFKFLGGCYVCLNFWIGLATIPLVLSFTGVPAWLMPFYLLLGNFILRKIHDSE